MPESTEDGMSHVGALVPHNHAEAIFQLASLRTTRSDKVSQSDLIRKYIKMGLAREVANGDAPGEIADLLDDDLVANAGGEE